MSNQQLAEAACESVYGTCVTGSCGSFYYYYSSASVSCTCSKPTGQYEFVYANSGYITVGQDYGGDYTSVDGNTLFVRRKASEGCNSNSWSLSLSNIG